METKIEKIDGGNGPASIKRAACIERVSTTKQQELHTIDAQISITEEYCRKMGYEIAGHYSDDGWSGGLSLRPESERLITDAEAGLFQIAVCQSVDRMSRNPEFYWRIVPTLKRAGIKVEYVQTPITGDNILLENVLVGVAADERIRIARRFANGKRQKIVVRKQLVIHRAGYGFKYCRNKNDAHDPGHLEHKQPEKKITEMIFRWMGPENVSSKETIRRLAEMKIKSPRGFPCWKQSTLIAMVRNEAYLGKFYYYRHESVIPKRYRKEEKFRKNLKTGHRIRPREEWALIEKPELRIIDDIRRLAWHKRRPLAQKKLKRQFGI